MTTEQVMANSSTAEEPGPGSPIQLTEHLADGLWQLTGAWNEYAKNAMGVPLLRAMDEVGLQLRCTLGRTPIGRHLQHIENARRLLIPVGYYLRLARKRGLVERKLVENLQGQLFELAQHLNRQRQAIVQAVNRRIAEQKQQQEKSAEASRAENNPMATAGNSVAH